MAKTAAKTDRRYEKQLIARACDGDRGAARTLVDLHKDRLFAFIQRMLRNHHDAEEICQEAFLKAFVSLDSFRTEYRFSTWLFTIGYRVCLNHLRRKRAVTGEPELTENLAHSSDATCETLESEEAARLRRTVWNSVATLSEPQRASLVLFYRHDMGCQEIARVLELPVATVKSHLHRARNRLRELLEPVADQDIAAFRNRRGLAG